MVGVWGDDCFGCNQEESDQIAPKYVRWNGWIDHEEDQGGRIISDPHPSDLMD